ncbi:hypothetical protein O6H91_14G078300 [Diphasiastrum complanatum]|uniref:Uncharacterized protein n=1 Tax=Diphasiastrum complanatum TaxID=34168 RepID=A0ACC2BR31_DIPCM|nr:hypothetical protein O6H91_14G078300 [Diphasiastrum complanatum]
MYALLGSVAVAVVVAWATMMVWVWRRRQQKKERAVAFFHPYTNDGGGGERVLWCAVKALQELVPDVTCAIYTGDATTPEALAQRALSHFGVHLFRPIRVVKLERRKWVEADTYPRFTLIGQSFGSIILAWEALMKFTPLVFFDTTGYAFTYPIVRACGCKVVCYTHYPTISSDMLSRVIRRTSMYNNNSTITRRCSNLVMVNSSWTQSHIEKLWRVPERVIRVYPPCDTLSLQVLPIQRTSKDYYIVSVAQFRPEKAHNLQLEAFAAALQHLGCQHVGEVEEAEQTNSKSPRLKLVGSCRNREDLERLQGLKRKCQELGIQDQVDFYENVSYNKLKDLLGGAVAGLHSMIDEHFGISVVEYMAAGAIPIAHNSAGPKEDIVLEEDGQKTGFLATTKDEFADAICEVLTMPEEGRLKMAKAARQRASRFSVENFDHNFKAAIGFLVSPNAKN